MFVPQGRIEWRMNNISIKTGTRSEIWGRRGGLYGGATRAIVPLTLNQSGPNPTYSEQGEGQFWPLLKIDVSDA